jgi:DNA-binding MarR family transcriptional regulator
LEDKGWLQVVLDQNDGRKRFLALTDLGRAEVDSLQTMWRAVDAAAKELCEEVSEDFFQSIQRFERALKRKSLRDRALEKMKRD